MDWIGDRSCTIRVSRIREGSLRSPYQELLIGGSWYACGRCAWGHYV